MSRDLVTVGTGHLKRNQALHLWWLRMERHDAMKCGSMQDTPTTAAQSGRDASPSAPPWTQDLVVTDELVDAFLKVAAALKAKVAAA